MVPILINPKWSEVVTSQMLIEYEKREYLWNPVSEHYKNKKIREQGHVEIINVLNLVDVTVIELKNKIRNIRWSYRVELKKIRAARKAGAHAYRPTVTWFEYADRFLRAIVTPSLDVDNSLLDIPAVSDDSDAVQDLSERKPPEKKSPRKLRSSTRSSTPYVLNTPSPRPTTPFGLNQASVSPSTSTSAPFLNPSVGIATPLTTSLATIDPIPTKQKKGNYDDRNGDHSDVPQDLNQHSENGNDNEFEIFGKLIASQLRKLPLSLALDTQLKIQTLVNAVRIQAVHQQYSYAGPSQEALSSVQAVSNGILASMAQQTGFASRIGIRNDSPDDMVDIKIEYAPCSDGED